MLTLADALSEVLANGDDWAAPALVRLGIDDVTALEVCAASVGWLRRFDAASPTDAPALFVLLPDRIGCGTPESMLGIPQWIALSSVTALEAMDETDTPLDTVELHSHGSVLTVGWPPAFCRAVVDALSHQGRSQSQESAVHAAESSDSAARRSVDELTSSGSDVVHDPSSLDSLAPSGWTEPPVAPVVPASTTVPPPVPSWAVPAELLSPTALDAPVVPAAAAVPAGPWLNPSMVWPDPIRGVAYVGRLPAYPRRRKNGTLTFAPAGFAIAGGGLSSWQMAFAWSDVEHISIQNAEELEFCEGVKIDATSSALSVQFANGEELVVEVRMRRPPSLRATLAPVLLMAEAIPGWRAEVERDGV